MRSNYGTNGSTHPETFRAESYHSRTQHSGTRHSATYGSTMVTVSSAGTKQLVSSDASEMTFRGQYGRNAGTCGGANNASVANNGGGNTGADREDTL